LKPIPTCLESHPSKACSEFMSYSLYELNCLAPASPIEYEVDKGRPNFWAWWTHAARSAIFLPQYLKRACARFLRGGAFSDHVPLSIMPFYNVRRDRQAVLGVASQGKYSWSAFCNNFWSGLRRDLRRRENVQCLYRSVGLFVVPSRVSETYHRAHQITLWPVSSDHPSCGFLAAVR